MNFLTFDIEEWHIEERYHGGRQHRYRLFDSLLDDILALLHTTGTRATFFCLGAIARRFPHVVRAIAEQGHEIGCHSDSHTWLTKMTAAQLRADTRQALDALEDVAGRRVVSYRAPAFSIGPDNRWALEVLAECGIERDASIFPTTRDFGGYPAFPADTPCMISVGGATIKEFPIPLTSILGRRMAFSGGGYFRLFPYTYVMRTMRRASYGMCYFHIGDLISAGGRMMTRAEYENYFSEPGTLRNRAMRYLKSNIGTANAFGKMQRLVGSIPFHALDEADDNMAWNNIVNL